MTDKLQLPRSAERAVFLTRLGLISERATRAFWPFWSVLFLVLSALMMGLHDVLPLEALWASVVISALAALGTLIWGIRRIRWPTRQDALDRLDLSMPGRPITALADTQAIGAGDVASEAVWQAHVKRMAARVEGAKPVDPNLRISDRDPYALRYVAVMAFATALIFGSIYRVSTVNELGTGGQALALGPTWEGWVEPPAYTGKPALYLNDIRDDSFEVPEGSRITLRLYGEIGALTVAETVSGRTEDLGAASDISQSFEVARSGELRIDGTGGSAWAITVLPDAAPEVEVAGPHTREADGSLNLPYVARDDYAVVAGTGTITLDLPEVTRTYGLAVEPDPREPLTVDLTMPITGDRAEFEEALIDNFSEHAFANLPVALTLTVEDDTGLTGTSVPEKLVLPGRRFFDPMAAAIIEQRRDLLWSRSNATRVAQVLRAVSHRPEDIFRQETSYLRLRVTLRRLENMTRYGGGLTAEQQDEIAAALWDLAVQLEEGDLSDALERLRRAQERVAEAMRNGANDQEIAELMQELRDAMQDYMRQLAQQQDEDEESQELAENTQTITGDQLQEMLDQLQQLMEEGRMAEAEQLLQQLQQMMENMQIARNQQGQGQQGEGQQAMEGLAETLRNQQGLSDEAFRDLQEQFNPNGQPGQQPGQQQGQGPGQQPGQPGQGQGQGQQQPGQQPGGDQDTAQGDGQGTGEGQNEGIEDSLANRQQALRQELERQRGNLPGAGTPEGDAARDSLGRAGEAMDDAEEALRDNDLAEAIDNQSEAMEALREGMRNLGEALAQQQQNGQGQQGEAVGSAETNPRDPLGRDRGTTGQLGTGEELLQGEDVYRRARDLLDEIRRRSGETDRPEVEREYLKRLLDRF